jgi:hypothetical protein
MHGVKDGKNPMRRGHHIRRRVITRSVVGGGGALLRDVKMDATRKVFVLQDRRYHDLRNHRKRSPTQS